MSASFYSDSSENCPNIESPDIVNYLLFTSSEYTNDQLKAYKSLDSYQYSISAILIFFHSQETQTAPLFALMHHVKITPRVTCMQCACAIENKHGGSTEGISYFTVDISLFPNYHSCESSQKMRTNSRKDHILNHKLVSFLKQENLIFFTIFRFVTEGRSADLKLHKPFVRNN